MVGSRGAEYDDVDIVAIGSSGFQFLENWEKILKPYTIYAIHTGDPKDNVYLPHGLNVEIYTKLDIERRLGQKSWIFNGQATEARSFGFLLCRKRFVFTIEEGILVGQKPDGEAIDAVQQHVRNLITPSTPFFFNTLYDPYCSGSDFVRGYPFTLRQGVPTALSHGLWRNIPDYDAPTRMCKPLERNDRYVDAVMTIPKGTLFPMSGRNVAFDRTLIGPLMYFGTSVDDAPAFFYPDMWAGWCSKVICDHLGLGIKSGLPYVFCNKDPEEPLKELESERSAMLLQEEIIPFFQHVQLSPESNNAVLCYIELADKVREQLASIDPFFEKLGSAMKIWIEVWDDHNPSD